MDKKKIIIAGGGFGGVHAGLTLAKLLPEEHITLISDTPYHSFHADLYEVVTAILPKERKLDFHNLSGTVNIPLSKIFAGTKVEILIEKVVGVNLPEKRIETNVKTHSYDYAVIALGSTTNFFNLEGAEEFGHPLKNTEDALNIRNDIEELIINSQEPITVAIAGAGFTGVEIAGYLPGLLQDVSRRYNKPAGKVLLVGSGKNVLEGMPVWAQESTRKRLMSLGIHFELGSHINKIQQNNLQTEKGKVISFDYLIWTTGIKGNIPIQGILGSEQNSKGQIKTNQDTSVVNHSDTFVVGDLAECMDVVHGCPISATAWGAIEQGKVAGENISRSLKEIKRKNFTGSDYGFFVPVGKKYVITTVGNKHITGHFGWLLRRRFSLNYFLSILSRKQAIALWWKGIGIYAGND